MSRMSDLDLMVREGERTAEDFIKRGIDARTARAMAEVVEATHSASRSWLEWCGECTPGCPGWDTVETSEGFTEIQRCDDCNRFYTDAIAEEFAKRPPSDPDSAYAHGPGCYGECDGLYDCS